MSSRSKCSQFRKTVARPGPRVPSPSPIPGFSDVATGKRESSLQSRHNAWRASPLLAWPNRKRACQRQALFDGCGGAQPDPEALAYQVVTLSNKSNLPDLPFPFRAGAIARQHGGVNHVDRRTGGVSLHLGLFAASDG